MPQKLDSEHNITCPHCKEDFRLIIERVDSNSRALNVMTEEDKDLLKRQRGW